MIILFPFLKVTRKARSSSKNWLILTGKWVLICFVKTTVEISKWFCNSHHSGIFNGKINQLQLDIFTRKLIGILVFLSWKIVYSRNWHFTFRLKQNRFCWYKKVQRFGRTLFTFIEMWRFCLSKILPKQIEIHHE